MIKVILSAAVSLDGCLDDTSGTRLKLSSPEDWEAVLCLRAECDAILVGAGTVRRDNPSLVVRDPELRAWRAAQGMEEDITKVTVTASGRIDPEAAFFMEGGGRKIVIAAPQVDLEAVEGLPGTEIVRMERITARGITQELERRGCRSLMVEGGSAILSMFLGEGCADVFRLAVAPFFVGEEDAPRLLGHGSPWNAVWRMKVARLELLGDTTVIWLEP